MMWTWCEKRCAVGARSGSVRRGGLILTLTRQLFSKQLLRVAIPFFILTHSISIGLMNGEKIMEADAIAVMKLWAVDQSLSGTVRYNQIETPLG